MFSAENPDSLRGPQFDCAWCDEIAKWRLLEETWDMLQFALRLGDNPQAMVTTTPRPLPLLKKIIEDAATVMTRAATTENAGNLAPSFVAEMTAPLCGNGARPAGAARRDRGRTRGRAVAARLDRGSIVWSARRSCSASSWRSIRR